MFALNTNRQRRIFAEIHGPAHCGFAGAATCASVGPVAGPSNNTPAADCQNRYPSPSKRSDPFPVRPLTFWGRWQRFAHWHGAVGKGFASAQSRGTYRGVTNRAKGERRCETNCGLARSGPCWCCRPAGRRRCNRCFTAPVPGRWRQQRLAPVQRPVRWSVLGQTCIARIPTSFADTLTSGATARRFVINGHRGFAPVALLFSANGRRALPLKPEGLHACSRKS
jgi:hypothetical protein